MNKADSIYVAGHRGLVGSAIVRELERREGRYALITLCIGIGQGIATIFERIE